VTDAPETERPWPKVSRLRTAGPVVLIVAALIAAGTVATVNEHSTTPPSNAPSTTTQHRVSGAAVPIT
jgi:hypothetical protein